MRSYASRALTLLLASSALAGCGGGSGHATTPTEPTPRDLRPHSASTSAAGRPAILAAVERAITTDARARVRRGEFRGPVKRTSCDERRGPGEGHQDVVVYSCLAITFVGPKTIDAPPLVSGVPFQAQVDFRDRRFAWCKVSLPGGEGTGRPGREHAPDAACGGLPPS